MQFTSMGAFVEMTSIEANKDASVEVTKASIEVTSLP